MLFVAPRYLLPADSGGKIRTGHVLRGLKGGAFELTMISPAPEGAAARDAAELAQLCDRYASWPEGRKGRLFSLLRARHLLSQLPIPVATDASAAGSALIASELARKPDLVVVDFPHTMILLPRVIQAASVLFTHNVETEIFARHQRLAKNIFLRSIWRNQLKKMRRFEGEALRRCDAVIAVSERDKIQFQADYGVDASITPTGVDLENFAYRAPSAHAPGKPNIVFTASMDSYANIDGMRWFMAEVWPLIAKARGDASVTIVGRKPDPKLVRDAQDRGLPWTFTGFVDDVRPYIYDATAYIIPLRVGGGTRIKAYEAMASGRPVVSTAFGVEGLPLAPERHYLLADAPQAFAQSVLRLLQDGGLRQRLAAEAYALVDRNFSARNVAHVFEEICLKALARKRGRTAA
jgi:glycosyltransferase involved in cell wall biosynthesis